MNAVPEAVGAPRTPLVDLLPPEIEMRRKARRSKRLIVVVVVLFFALLAGAWYYTYSVRVSAESDLAAEQSKTAEKQAELATYDYIPIVRAALDNAVNARALAGSTDVTWATQLNSILTATPNSISLTSLTVSAANPSAPLIAPGNAFQQPDIGQLSFTGEAATELEIAAFQDAIDSLPAFRDTYINSVTLGSTGDGDVPYWSFSGTTRITSNALSGRTVTEQTFPSPSPSAESEG